MGEQNNNNTNDDNKPKNKQKELAVAIFVATVCALLLSSAVAAYFCFSKIEFEAEWVPLVAYSLFTIFSFGTVLSVVGIGCHTIKTLRCERERKDYTEDLIALLKQTMQKSVSSQTKEGEKENE